MFSNIDKKQTICILGGTGFIGRHLLKYLSKQNNIILKALTRKNDKTIIFANNVQIVLGDLMSYGSITKFLVPDSTVINLAYLNQGTREDNLKIIKNLTNACIDVDVKRLIHCSTAVVVGRSRDKLITEETVCKPVTQYERTKLTIENYLLERLKKHCEIAILRPTSVFGPGGKNLMKLTNDLRDANQFKNYLKSCLFATRNMNLVFIDNVVSALVFLMETSLRIDKDIFIISDDDSPKNNFWGVEKHLIQCLKYDDYLFPRIHLPGWMLKIALILARRPFTQFNRVYHSGKIMEAGFQKTISFENGLNAFAKWYERDVLSSSKAVPSAQHYSKHSI
jgi:nucleoside-diphosphate-sugar epimerase